MKKTHPSVTIPTVVLPKSSGSSTQISEQFQPDLCTGGGHYEYKLDVTQARSLTPDLKLIYSSQYGTTSFGHGFLFSASEIKRKTNHGAPRYDDDIDIFIFSGENLVCINKELINKDEKRWIKRTYLPQTLNQFVVIEYWRSEDHQEVTASTSTCASTETENDYWLVKYPEGINEVYGIEESAKIADPNNTKKHIFSWLLSERYDGKGNRIAFRYQTEITIISIDVSSVFKAIEYNLHSISYGNYFCDNHEIFAFQIDLYYKNTERADPTYSFRSGFPIKVSKLCEKIILSHQLSGQENSQKFPVREWNFKYEVYSNGQRSFLTDIQKIGILGLLIEYAPPISFQYQPLNLPEKIEKYFQLQEQDGDINQNISNTSVSNQAETSARRLNIGDLSFYQFVDLYGEGLPGILYSNLNTTFFWRNKGNGFFAHAEAILETPRGMPLNGRQSQLIDLFGDQKLEWVISHAHQVGYYTLESDGKFGRYHLLETYPIQYDSEHAEFLDLEGSGRVGVLIWGGKPKYYPGYGLTGFGKHTPLEECYQHSRFPQGAFSVGESYWLGFVDIFGDTLLHRVCIRNGYVDCWPNLGNGRFGPKISFNNPPRFVDHNHDFSKKQLFLSDIGGSGRLDLIYIQRNTLDIYFNQGLSFSEKKSIELPEPFSQLDNLHFVDILGKGSSCFIFSKGGYHPKHYFYDFSPQGKPFLLYVINNGAGLETRIEYQSSIKTYLSDIQSPDHLFYQRSLRHKLHFPVSVISKIIFNDLISQCSYIHRYIFHGGYYDTVEREFVGFGVVEHIDAMSDDITQATHKKTWFHTGASDEDLLNKEEYFRHEEMPLLPENQLIFHITEASKSYENIRKGNYALKRKIIHEEIYQENYLDCPYKIIHSTFNAIYRLNNFNNNCYFFIQASENIIFNYECVAT